MIPGKNCPAPTWPSPAPVLTPEHQKPPVTLSCDEEAQPRKEDMTLSFPWPLVAFGSKWRQSGRFGKKDIFKWSWLIWLLHETGKCIGLAKKFVRLMNIFSKVLCENGKKKVSHFYLKSNELFGQPSKYWSGNVLGIGCDFLFKSNPVLGFTWHFTQY